MSVRALQAVTREAVGAHDLLLLLEGKLIVDLPGGDFRVLREGDALQPTSNVILSFTPVAGEAVLAVVHAVG